MPSTHEGRRLHQQQRRQRKSARAGFTLERDTRDPRHATFRWQPVARCDGCMIHYGVAPDALHLSLQYQNPAAGKLTVSCLNKNVKYFYRLDVYDDSGVTEGSVTTTAQQTHP